MADFNTTFIERVIAVTGQDLFPPRPFDIPTWNYPQHYGYTEAQVSSVWAGIVEDPLFWQNLATYPDTLASLQAIAKRSHNGDDIYFVTSRPGIRAKQQTEKWLRNMGLADRPTVLISGSKGLIAAGLKLDTYIDDRWENALDVAVTTRTRSYLLDRPWNTAFNAGEQGIHRVASVAEFFEAIA